MRHWFLSMALVYENKFISYPMEPEIQLEHLQISDVMLSRLEYDALRADLIVHISQIMADHLPQLSHFRLHHPVDSRQHHKTPVIRLPAWPLNEQNYQDVVKILDGYQKIVDEVYSKADVSVEPVHIGGDQLTRERFTGAKQLRIGNNMDSDRFDSLGPITFEFFHLGMNFLETVIFKQLFGNS